MRYLLLTGLLCPLLAHAEPPPLTQPVEEPGVEANIREMDADRDGMVSMAEIRVYLQKQYGKGYKQTLLEKLESRAEARSCGSPFSRPTF